MLEERMDAVPWSAAQMLRDLETAARQIEAPFCEATTRRILDVFAPEFSSCVVQLKAACKTGSGLYYRFFYPGPSDLTARALAANLLENPDSPNVKLQAEILAKFPRATRAGLDFEAQFGLAKVWTFTGGPTPLREILKLENLPPSVREAAPFFAEFGLKHVFFVASDYQGDTMNVYFGWENGGRNIAWIRKMVEITGGAAPSEAICAEILATQAASGGVGFTFSWNKPGLQRWCLYSLEVPPDARVTLPARLEKFREAPTLNACPQINLAWSFGGARSYMKMEKSYARDATFFLTNQMGGDLSR